MSISASGIVVYKTVASEPSFLLLRNAAHGTWGFPKGHMEPGEDRLAGAKRECTEETGLKIESCTPGFRKRTEHTCISRATGEEELKETWYFLSPVDEASIVISREHAESVWESRLDARQRLQFDTLRELLDCAYSAAIGASGTQPSDGTNHPEATGQPVATGQPEAAGRPEAKGQPVAAGQPYATGHPEATQRDAMKHPDVTAAYDLLDALSQPEDLWRRHCLKVADVCCLVTDRLLDASPDLTLDRPTLEAGALLHDIGRSVDHGIEHPWRGMETLVKQGLGHLAKPCISHWLKGRKRCELTSIPHFTQKKLDLLFTRFDLETMTIKEKIISVVDSLVHQDRLVPLDVRYKSIRERYGDSPWMYDNERITKGHIQELEAILGTPLYDLLRL